MDSYIPFQGVYYGPGSVSTALPTLLVTLGASKVLVITGNSLYYYTDVCLGKPPSWPRSTTLALANTRRFLESAPTMMCSNTGADIIVSVGGEERGEVSEEETGEEEEEEMRRLHLSPPRQHPPEKYLNLA